MSKFRSASRLQTQSPGNVQVFLFVTDNSRRLTSENGTKLPNWSPLEMSVHWGEAVVRLDTVGGPSLTHSRPGRGSDNMPDNSEIARASESSLATSTFTIAAGRIRALTAAHPIKPTSLICRSARQPNLGRRSTYRCGKSVQTTETTSVRLGRRANVKALTILPALLVGATLALSVTPAAAWWQFVMNGPNGERQISPHFETEEECKSVLKITDAELAKKYPDRYPLVGSCEQYR